MLARCAIAITSTLAGCSTAVPVTVPIPSAENTKVLRTYSGPVLPFTEIGIVSIANSQIDVRVRFIDGIRVEGQRVFHLPPGDSVMEIRCFRPQPRDPMGSWRGHEVLEAKIQANRKYHLRTRTEGPGRAGMTPNICTSWIEDRDSGEVVSEVIYARY